MLLLLGKGIINYTDLNKTVIADTYQGKKNENLTHVRLKMCYLLAQSNYTEFNLIAYRHPVPRILTVFDFL